MVYKASKVIAQEDSCPGCNRTTLPTRGCWSKSNLTALSHAGGHGLPSPPASKARALERKLENWWKIKITLQIGFVGGFIMLRGSAVSHRRTGALLKQAVGWQRVGKEGTDTVMHIQLCGKTRGKDHGAVPQEVTVFSAAQNTYLAPLTWRAKKGLQAESTEIKARCLGKRKGSYIQPLWRSQEDQELKTWRVHFTESLHAQPCKPIFVPSSSSPESHIQLSLTYNLCAKWEKEFFFSFWEDATVE